MSPLRADEDLIEGHWLEVDGKVVADDAAWRIDELIAEHLAYVAVSTDGWSKLFRDPNDGRLWEHTYPQSQMHGGGPPRLEAISHDEAQQRFAIEP